MKDYCFSHFIPIKLLTNGTLLRINSKIIDELIDKKLTSKNPIKGDKVKQFIPILLKMDINTKCVKYIPKL